MDTKQKRDSTDKGGTKVRADYHPLERFNAFSDGVFAIVITLLVLELPAPPEGVSLPQSLAETWPEFLGYFISFAFVGGIWLSDASLTRLMKQGGRTFLPAEPAHAGFLFPCCPSLQRSWSPT